MTRIKIIGEKRLRLEELLEKIPDAKTRVMPEVEVEFVTRLIELHDHGYDIEKYAKQYWDMVLTLWGGASLRKELMDVYETYSYGVKNEP